eukprot:GHVS01076443.1.p1 GENE.GHVS01076443.1~~GHVS01076443.1.p1  ORF type:complete len:618 (+),score=64.80 GHVS01076443.1:191-1855(+)
MSAATLLLSHGSWPESSGVRHLMVSAVLYVKSLPSIDVLHHLLQTSLVDRFRNFRSRPVPSCSGGGNVWEDVDVCVEDHVVCEEVKGPFELDQRLNEIINLPYKIDKPRWDFHLVKNKQGEKERGGKEDGDVSPSLFHVVVFRFDHCIGDGVSMVEVFSRLLTDINSKPLSPNFLHGLIRRGAKGQSDGTAVGVVDVSEPDRMRQRVSDDKKNAASKSNALSAAATDFKSAVAATARYCKDSLVGSTLCRIGSAVVKVLVTLGRAASSCKNICRGAFRTMQATSGGYDTMTEFSWDLAELKEQGVKMGNRFKLVKSPPLNMECLRAIKKPAGCSVNDVLLCAFAGVVRRYCSLYGRHGSKISMEGPLRIRALLPYAFPRPVNAYVDGDTALSNRMAMTPVDLAVNHATAPQRLNETIRVVQDVKSMYLPYVIKFVQWFAGSFLPIKVLRQIAGDLFARHSVVFANVPGYQQPCKLAGELVYEVQIAFCSVLPQVEILSYAGRLFFNVVANSGRLSHMEEIPQLFVEELQQLADSFGVTEPVLHPHPYHYSSQAE